MEKRICYSSSGAEIIAAADADDRGFHRKEAISELFSQKKIEAQNVGGF